MVRFPSTVLITLSLAIPAVANQTAPLTRGRSVICATTPVLGPNGMLQRCVLAQDTGFTNIYSSAGQQRGSNKDTSYLTFDCAAGGSVILDADGNVTTCTLPARRQFLNRPASGPWTSIDCAARAVVTLSSQGIARCFPLFGGIQQAPVALSVTINPPRATVAAAGELVTRAVAIGGAPPYQYQWFESQRPSAATSAGVRWTLKKPGPRLIRVVVTDSKGAVAEAGAQVEVQEAAQAAGSTPPPAASATPPSRKNLALASNGASASQSSTYSGICPSAAGKAIDGVTGGIMANHCPQASHTAIENRPWWRVDLGAVHTIDSIVIWNRTDVAMERLSDFTVSVLDSSGKVLFSRTAAGPPKPSLAIPIPGVAGRSVQVQLNGTNYLHMAEVQVFGR
jgi:hypothetical protein